MGESDDVQLPRVFSRRFVLLGSATFGGVVLLAACGTDSKSKPSSGSDPITVKDQRGKTLKFDSPVTRIVTLPVPAAAMLICIDKSAKHVVGMHEASWTAIKDGIMGEMFPDALTISHDVSGESFAPNVESILALKADVVVQWADHGDGVVAPLENAGLTVAGLNYGTQDDLTAWITIFATMLGKSKRGDDMLARINAALKKAKATGKSRKAGPKVLYLFQGTGAIKPAGTGTYNDYYIKLAGATNPAAENGIKGTGTAVDIEQVLAWDPDVVLLGNFDPTLPEDIYKDQVWQGISAVKSKRVYKVPLGGYRWDPPSQESPLMWQWLEQVCFPKDKYDSLRDAVVDYYQFLYGYKPSASQMDTMLWKDANSGSADYGQFDAP